MAGRGRLRRSHDQRERRLARGNHRNGRLRRKWLGRCDEVRRVGGEVGRVRVAAVAAAKETVCTHRRDADEHESRDDRCANSPPRGLAWRDRDGRGVSLKVKRDRRPRARGRRAVIHFLQGHTRA